MIGTSSESTQISKSFSLRCRSRCRRFSTSSLLGSGVDWARSTGAYSPTGPSHRSQGDDKGDDKGIGSDHFKPCGPNTFDCWLPDCTFYKISVSSNCHRKKNSPLGSPRPYPAPPLAGYRGLWCLAKTQSSLVFSCEGFGANQAIRGWPMESSA